MDTNEDRLAKVIAGKIVEAMRGFSRLIPVALSNRHVHLSAADFAALFGLPAVLTKLRDLSQPGQFVARETVTLLGPKGSIEGVRILGPFRRQSQVEISLSDGYRLGVRPPVRDSGELEGTPGLILAGPGRLGQGSTVASVQSGTTHAGRLELPSGVICAARHIHMHPRDAAFFEVSDRDLVSVRAGGRRGLTFDNVLVRVSPDFRLEMHLDLEEGNAAALGNGDLVEFIERR